MNTAALAAVGQESFRGNYRIAPDHMIGIDRFITDNGEPTLLFSDYQSGVVRQIFQVADTGFVMGPGFAVKSPAELDIKFEVDANGNVTGAVLTPVNGPKQRAEKLKVTETRLDFKSGSARLSGTLLTPATAGPHPAIVLLHGSGPLTRYSFGPYPRFFVSLGFAVLIYDKRGTGESTGELLDSSTGAPLPLPDDYFPERLISDAEAALQLLRQRPGVDPERIGLWGSSEGGMLATQVAARDKRVAFVIDSSGALDPLWETTQYQAGRSLKRLGFSDAQIEMTRAATRAWINAARTGEGFTDIMKQRATALKEKKGWIVGWTRLDITTPEQLKWYWEHVMSFDPLPQLAMVKCPILALFGGQDTSTDTASSIAKMRNVLTRAGHPDFTIRLFPNAGHSLSEEPSGNRMAPAVFQTLRTWLLERGGQH